MDFIIDNWYIILPLLYEVVVRLWPTKYDISILDAIFNLISVILTNRKKNGGTWKIKMLTIPLLFFALSCSAQLNGNFKSVRFVNVLDSTTVLPVNGSIYYNEQSFKFRVYENGVWKDLIGSGGGGGGGLTTASNGLSVSGSDVRLGGFLDFPTGLNLGGQVLNFTGGTGSLFAVNLTNGGETTFTTQNGNIRLSSGSGGLLQLDPLNSIVDLGTSSRFGGTRTIRAMGLASNVGIQIQSKGSGNIINNAGSGDFIVNSPFSNINSPVLTLGGSLGINTQRILTSNSIGNANAISMGSNEEDNFILLLGDIIQGGSFRSLRAHGSLPNINLSLDSKGTGNITLGTNGPSFVIQRVGPSHAYQLNTPDFNTLRHSLSSSGTLTNYEFLTNGANYTLDSGIGDISLNSQGDIIITGIPTSNPCGVSPPGTIWNDTGTLKICP